MVKVGGVVEWGEMIRVVGAGRSVGVERDDI